ncbi:hypothetical protein N7495_009906 [Penicillium taxi]|uniref:uncharacterized protein n=1 Tax=Penicillium taxi TaxID=168475 RepID=UPI002545303E|nr:uncharacterized protein N7495_009906 [Penicillium taxi]KAJ5885396.1 hypothetical protein N7495_009906 [Penicillium taxi]
MPPDRRTQKIVRVRTGCWTCRRRKKKCDETRPICIGCTRNHLACSWPSIPGPCSHEKEITPSNEDKGSSLSHATDELEAFCNSASPASRHSPASQRHSSVSSSGSQSGIVKELDESTPPEELNRWLIIPPNDQTALSSNMVVASVPQTLSMLPGFDAESHQLLSHYVSTTADIMANGSTPINPFLVQIVPLAFTSDILLQLVITQSAAHRAFRSHDESDAVADVHYTKAIRMFRRGVSDFIDGKESNPLMLLIGALLMCFTETAKGDMTGTIFDHLAAAHSLLIKLLGLNDAAIPRELKDFVVEYYTYTASVSMISIDARLSGQIFLNFDLAQQARLLLRTQYVGNLCGCWLELLILVPCIFELGRQWMMDEAPPMVPTADEIATFASIQAQILRWSPYSFVDAEVYLAGLIFQQAMLIYLYTSLGGYAYARDGMYKNLIRAAVREAMAYLEELTPSARVNSGMCWPIAVVGSCLESVDLQNRLRTRTKTMARHFGLGNMHRTLQLLEAMWELPAVETGPWNICRTMQDKQIWISFA